MISATKVLDRYAAAFASPATVVGFDPRPFLSARTAEAFAAPDCLLLPDTEQQCPATVKGSLSRPQLLDLYKRLDAIGRQHLEPLWDGVPRCDARDRAEIFGVY